MRKPFISNGVSSDQKKIIFQVEQADRSVGIMSEGFSAWEEGGTAWCNLDDIGHHRGTIVLNGKEVPADIEGAPRFTWYDNETGEACKPPVEHKVVQAALVGFANGYYENESEPLCPCMNPDCLGLCGSRKENDE